MRGDGVPEVIDVYVGQQIRVQRRLRGMSQTVLADKIGLTFQQVQKYERGVNRVSASKLWAICNVLELPISKFFPPQEGATTSEGMIQAEKAALGLLGQPGGLELIHGYSELPTSLQIPVRGLVRGIAKELRSLEIVDES